MTNYYQSVEADLINLTFLTFKFDYFELGDSLTVVGYTNDNVLRIRIIIQNSEVPEFDIYFGMNISYYASLSGHEAATNYLSRLMEDLSCLNDIDWCPEVGEMLLTGRPYISPSLGLKALKSPPMFLLHDFHKQEIRVT